MDVAVLGAGPLGRDLAGACARAGHHVALHDAEATVVMDAIDALERRSAGAESDGDGAGPTERIDGTTGLEAAVGEAELVVETATTDQAELQARFAEVEELVDRETLLATAAGDVSVTGAVAGLRHPDRAIGLHVPDPLEASTVEVVVADQTTAETVDRVEAVVEGLGLAPALIADAPGLVSTRLALATEAEAMRLVAEGVAGVADVDAAFARRFDHPIGPLERADRAGLDRRLSRLEYLAGTLGDRFRPPELLAELVSGGQTGLEAGEGFYAWENGEPVEPAIPDPDVVERVAGPDDPAGR